MFRPLAFDLPCKAPIETTIETVAEHLLALGYEESGRSADSVTFKFAGKLLTTHLDEARHQTKIIATGLSIHVLITWPWWINGVLTDDEKLRLAQQAEEAARAAAAKAMAQ